MYSYISEPAVIVKRKGRIYDFGDILYYSIDIGVLEMVSTRAPICADDTVRIVYAGSENRRIYTILVDGVLYRAYCRICKKINGKSIWRYIFRILNGVPLYGK